MRISEYLDKKILEIIGLTRYNGTEEEDRITFINDKRVILEEKLQEYNVWYEGDSDEILNYYTVNNTIDYNTEPIYHRNKRGYFWCISSTESDIKRTHSGQPRNIVDTMVSIVGRPEINAGVDSDISTSESTLKKILDENNFWDVYTFEQMPMVMVEGWGAYKISWDLDESDMPIIKYYRAKDVDFIYDNNKRIVGIIFKDFYIDKDGKKFMIAETRRIYKRSLYVTSTVFSMHGDDVKELGEDEIENHEDLKDIVRKTVKIENFNKLLATPCVFFRDNSNNDGYGRSVYTGKVDLFDDLDQCLSQSSNTVRRSTAMEYFNSDYLERDKKGQPIMPTAFDRKYMIYKGGQDADGSSTGTTPVQVTQPQLQFNEYSTEAQQILLQIISGFMAPATMGIDVAKKDNADAQREKEKVTIFTRGTLVDAEERILRNLFNQILTAQEYMNLGKITCTDYNISIKFSEFADDSFENKLSKLGDAYVKGMLSTDMYLDKLYGESISTAEREKEKNYLEEHQQGGQDAAGGFGADDMMNMMGGEGDESDAGF